MAQLPERFRLADGYDVPRLINGCWQLAHLHSDRRLDRERTLQDLETLVRAGLTAFDCADIYTGVEELLGELRRRLRPSGLAFAVHTKCVPNRSALPRLTRREIERTVHRSLRRLDIERLDLVQFHWWDFDVPGWVDAASWLADLQTEGKIARLGLTNIDVPHMTEILEAGVPIVSAQVQYSLLDRRPESALATFCRDQEIELLCYGTLAGGFLTDRYLDTPPPESPLANRSLVKYRLIVDEAGGWDGLQRLLSTLAPIAAKHSVSIANVATRWVLDRGAVAAVIVGVADGRHLESNLELFRFRLDVADRRRIDDVLQTVPRPPGGVYALERNWNGPHGRILWTDLNAEIAGPAVDN